jgi:hypothetical protein
MTTLYKILTGVVSVLAIAVCILAYYLQLDGDAGLVVKAVVGLALASAGGMWAILGLRQEKSDKSVRR